MGDPSIRAASRKAGTTVGLLEASLAALLLLVALPSPAHSGTTAEPLYPLEAVERIGASVLKGPEDVVQDADGNILTGCGDGAIYKIAPSGDVTRFVATGGRPLGLALSPDGELLVCDVGRKEVLSIAPNGVVRVLANSADERPLNFPDDLCAARDGTVYVTDATTYQFGKEIQDLVRGRPLGRLVRIMPDKRVEVVKDGLFFPNGVVLSQDERFLYVSETPKSRILRIALTGEEKGRSEVFVDGLPGFIDGISMDSQGNILAAIPAISEKDRVRIEGMPLWLRGLLSYMPSWLLPAPGREGMVLRIRPDRGVEVLIADPQGQKIPSVTNVIEAGGFYYMGFLYYGDGIARLPK